MCLLQTTAGGRRSLHVGGRFRYAGPYPSMGIAEFRSCVPCIADVSGNDGQVDVNDLLLVITSWGACPTPPTPCPADINDDSQVDVNDLLAVITSWGACP